MRRYFVTGTDTDVGKTRVAAALAAAFVAGGSRPTIVKAVQTGLEPGVAGDAAEAGALAGCASLELARFRLAADPWSAALADGVRPLEARELARQIEAVQEPVVIEGSGGAAVPLNAGETLATVAAATGCSAVLAVGVRLGCISHALLSLAYLAERGVPVLGVILVERWRPSDADERARVVRSLEGHAAILAVLDYDVDAARSVAQGARVLGSHPALELTKVGLRA